MNKPEGYDEAQAFTGEFEKLELGGHVCIIKQAKVDTTQRGKDVLIIVFDVADGPNKGFYQRQFDRQNESGWNAKWQGIYRQLTEGNSTPFFKGLITSIEKSNNGYTWNWDEKTLKGKLFGGVFGEEEYLNNKGELKVATKCMQIRSTDGIKDAEIPKIKRLPHSDANGFIEVDNSDDLPF